MYGLLLRGVSPGCGGGQSLRGFLSWTLCARRPRGPSGGGSASALKEMEFCVQPRAKRGFVVNWRTERVLRISKESTTISPTLWLNPLLSSGAPEMLRWLSFDWWLMMVSQGVTCALAEASLGLCQPCCKTSSSCSCSRTGV